VEVAAVIGRLAAQPLGRDVREAADDRAVLRELRAALERREPEIDQDHAIERPARQLEHEVRRLEIAVEDAERGHGGPALPRLPRVADGAAGLDPALLLDHAAQRLAAQELEREERPPVA